VTREGSTVGGTSIMGLMMLAASPGCSILVEAEGRQADEVLECARGAGAGSLRRRSLNIPT
jgi:phosphotransferase system HPr (HPr) family protein